MNAGLEQLDWRSVGAPPNLEYNRHVLVGHPAIEVKERDGVWLVCERGAGRGHRREEFAGATSGRRGDRRGGRGRQPEIERAEMKGPGRDEGQVDRDLETRRSARAVG